MSSVPPVSIVIVSYRTREVLRQCLRSVVEHAGVEYETIVVDNASDDGSAEMVREDFPGMTLVASERNLGFSEGNNVGLRHARGRYVLLLNPDTILQPGSLSVWLDQHTSSGAGISGPRLLHPDGSLQVSAWKLPGLWNSFLELFLLHRITGSGTYPAARFQADFRPDFVSGAALLLERELLVRLGGLDPELFWMEDVDLCVRVRRSGRSCHYFHGPTIVHIGGESAKRDPARAIGNQLISRIKFARKYEPWPVHAALALVVFLHMLTRALAFGVLAVVRTEPRARAYRSALAKLFRYLFRGDRSI